MAIVELPPKIDLIELIKKHSEKENTKEISALLAGKCEL